MTAESVKAVRSFNRFYTRQIGLLHKGYLNSPFSLTDVRVLYELTRRAKSTAAEVSKELGIDAGYLSRILLSFEKRGLIRREPSQRDGRQSHLSLTQKGRKAFAPLEGKAKAEVAAMLARLSTSGQSRMIEAMGAIEKLLGAAAEPQTPYLLRPHQVGDMGWIVHRHAVVYAREYGWDEQFEALAAEIAAKFLQDFNPKRERCWIAEKDGAIAGCVFLVRKSTQVAKLRLLFVEPSARGLGIGNRLVDECIRFARQVGYKAITLWTQKNLLAAIHLYRKAGFRLVHEEPHHSFGHDLVAQTWELTL